MKSSTACLLTKGQIAFYDLEDAHLVEQYKWQARWSKFTKSYYAKAGIRAGTKVVSLQMSRLIMGLDKNNPFRVDHINHDTLDNRKENLRIVTVAQNNQNRRGVKGYSWNPLHKKWEANIRRTKLGYFDTELEARQAYLNARQAYGFIEGNI